MFSATTALFAASLLGSALGHMQMITPPPLRGKTNPNSAAVGVDFDMSSPLSADGSNFPCKGYLKDLGTPSGASVASYAPGSQQTFVLGGDGAPHGGGSMQVSLSYDSGSTFKVIQSFIGNAPRNTGGNGVDPNQTYDFTIPQDAASGDAILSWSWFNEIGNREMYQNCAVVTITGDGTNKLESNPDMFVANVGNGCATVENVDLDFPNPGPNVTRGTPVSGASPGPAVGTCAVASSDPTPADPPANPPSDPTADPTTDAPAPSATAPSDPGCNMHVVVSGETCNIIAAANGLTAAQIMSLNPSINSGCTNLLPGEVLTLRRRSRIMRK